MSSPLNPGGAPQTFCGFCGYADTEHFTFCPRCGRPAATLGASGALSGEQRPSAPMTPGSGATFGSSPTQPGSQPYQAGSQPVFPEWPGASAPLAGPYGPSAGYSGPYLPGGVYPQSGFSPGGPASAPLAAPPPAKKRWSRAKRLSVIGSAVLAFLIVASASAYFIYTAFFAFNQIDSARYLPANTIFYTSLDLQQFAQGNHQISQSDLAQNANSSGFEQATGLNFQQDVLPWIGRGFTSAIVNFTRQGPQSGFGTVFLISTRDTNASNASIQKVINTQQQKYHVTFTSISYGGVTLQSDVDSARGQYNGATPLVLGIVKDQVLIANTVAVAEQVVDRANGNGDTLAKNPTFTNAVAKLPSDRFGTIYVNMQELLSQELNINGGSSQPGLINNYPVGYGALEFTGPGTRLTFTLEAKPGTQINQTLSGDTNASAGVVPASTILYAGLGNLGSFFKSLESLSGGALTDQNFQQTIGLGPDDPLFNAPASLALLPPTAGSNDVVDPLVLLHFSIDPNSANAKVQQVIQNFGYQTSTSTISGVTVTAIDAPQQTIYEAILGHDLVFAYDTDGLTQAINTFQGKQASLAQSNTFKQLVSSAAQKNALTVFISLENLANAPGSLGDAYRQAMKQSTSLLNRITATYLTYNSDSNGITITEDIALK